jgi:hypothetical protein
MQKTILVSLVVGFIALSGFKSDPVSHEQLILDYFLTDVLPSDFNNVSVVEFKGKTENTYSTLGNYKICLKPEEKLQSMLERMTKGSTTNVKELSYRQIDRISITDFKTNSGSPKLYIYPELHVADQFYVFLKFSQPGESDANYIFQVDLDGDIRSCKMD